VVEDAAPTKAPAKTSGTARKRAPLKAVPPADPDGGTAKAATKPAAAKKKRPPAAKAVEPETDGASDVKAPDTDGSASTES
jgi:hypothetical protein